MFPVTAGAHRYSFCTARYGSYSPTRRSITNLSIIATYYPTSYGAVVTAPAEAPQAGLRHPRVDAVRRNVGDRPRAAPMKAPMRRWAAVA